MASWAVSRFLAVVSTAHTPEPCDFRISFGGSVHFALRHLRDALRGHSGSAADDFVVCLDGGLHSLGGEPLRLDASFNRKDGGRVVWQSIDPDTPAVFSGGARLSGAWRRCGQDVRCPGDGWTGVWVKDLADIDPHILPFRQLWVNGRRARRVATNLAFLQLAVNKHGLETTLPASTFESWVESQVELRWPGSITPWIEPRCIVTGVKSVLIGAQSGTQLIVEPGCWTALFQRNGNTPPPELAENTPLSAPKPGEFYATRQRIFYRPFPEDAGEQPVNVWFPLQATLLEAHGLDNHEWRHIHFSHATWRQPSNHGGYVPDQSAACTANGESLGAVAIQRSRRVTFDGCVFTHLGAAYALSITNASQHARITHCRIADCSGGAVKLGNVGDARELSKDPALWDVGFLLRHNTIEDVGLEFRDAAAIFAGYVRDTVIEQNTIKNTGYTGISLGWGWGAHISGPQTFAQNNHIRQNRLQGIMLAMNDGGCIYTLGPQPNSTVEGNYCQMSGGANDAVFFYFDNGSRYFKASNNVADDGPGKCLFLQGCCGEPALDIKVEKTWCRWTARPQNDCEKYNCSASPLAQHVLEKDVPWPAEAQAIVDAAGAAGVPPQWGNVLAAGSQRQAYNARCLKADRFKVGELLALGQCGFGTDESPQMWGCPEDFPWKPYDPSGICSQSTGSGDWVCAPGWVKSAPVGCRKVTEPEFFVVEGTMRILSLQGKELCVTRAHYDNKHGTPLLLDECKPGFALQWMVGMCLHGDVPGAAAGAVVRSCQRNAPVPLKGGSLFCFMGVVPNSGDVVLAELAQSSGQGIFACDASKVHYAELAGTYESLYGPLPANAETFHHIWMEVFIDQIYKDHDWTVKVDPDTVFLPQRLRERLFGLAANIFDEVYVKDSEFGFLGAIEIFSQTAVVQLSKTAIDDCAFEAEGEDWWIHRCMTMHTRIGAREDSNILNGDCNVETCGDPRFVAFHQFKDADSWNNCAMRLR